METLAAEKNLEDPKVKNEIAAQVLPLIQDIPSPIERDTYVQRLARLLRVNEKALLETATPQGRSRSSGRRLAVSQPAPRSALRSDAASMSSYSLEVHCLGILLHLDCSTRWTAACSRRAGRLSGRF
jgi:DNA primase